MNEPADDHPIVPQTRVPPGTTEAGERAPVATRTRVPPEEGPVAVAERDPPVGTRTRVPPRESARDLAPWTRVP